VTGGAFWDNLAAGRFALPRCAGCGRWRWPEVVRCRDCGGVDLPWAETALTGAVHSWTRTHHPFSPVRETPPPYVVALVRLPAAGDVRVLGILRGPAAGLALDAPVTGTIEPPAPSTYDLPSVSWRLAGAAS
jgi:uncharacterized protein